MNHKDPGICSSYWCLVRLIALALVLISNTVTAKEPTEELAKMRDDVSLAANVFLP